MAEATYAVWQAHPPSMLCLHDTRQDCSKVAAFDLDGTLVRWKPGMKFRLSADSWLWWNPTVPGILRARTSLAQGLQQSGFQLVIFTNQALIKDRLDGEEARNFKAKVNSILDAAGVRASVYVATLKDGNRKPSIGMWHKFCATCAEQALDMGSSFYVGDAAGRPGNHSSGKQKDHSADDKDFARNAGLRFVLPEDIFCV